MSGPGTPAKGGSTTNSSSTTQTPATIPPKSRTKLQAGGGFNAGYHDHVTEPNNMGENGSVTKTVKHTSKSTGLFGVETGGNIEIDQETTTYQNNKNRDGNAIHIRQGSAGANIQVEYDSNPRLSTKPVGKAAHSSVKNSKGTAAKSLAAPVANLPTTDAIIISSADAPLERGNIDKMLEGSDATQDAEKLAAAAQRLQKQLKDLGLAGKSDLLVKGLENLTQVDKLAVTIQRDYTGAQESTIQLDFKDRRDASFNGTLASVDVTPTNIEQLTCALDKATEAVKKMASEVSPGQSVTEQVINQTVFKAITKETKDISH